MAAVFLFAVIPDSFGMLILFNQFTFILKITLTHSFSPRTILAPVVQKVDRAIHSKIRTVLQPRVGKSLSVTSQLTIESRKTQKFSGTNRELKMETFSG